MATTDRLTPELWQIKKEVDCLYMSNRLVSLPFPTAAWNLLAFSENEALKESFHPVTSQDISVIVDTLVNKLNYPMRWLYRTCKRANEVLCSFNDNHWRSSRDLVKLGKKYNDFVAAYTYASRGWIGLDLHQSTIVPSENFSVGIEYEAYNRLIKPHESQASTSSVVLEIVQQLNPMIESSLTIQGDRFSYKLNPKMVAEARKLLLTPVLDDFFLLPSEWQLSRYTFGEFRQVFESISAMAAIHAIARRKAREQGCSGYPDSICMPTRDELQARVARYSEVSDSTVRHILDDLTYGNQGMLNPDPALQPLIKLNPKVYAIMPHLWIGSSPERNLTVLLNRFSSDEKKIYSQLVSQNESLMRERFTPWLFSKGFRPICGSVPPDFPDIDLAIISDSEKTCLLLELKWFIYPAEASEVIARSKALAKGISQVVKLKKAFANNYKPLIEELKIDSSYRLEGAVVSQNWVGHAKVQSPDIPVIQADHLIAKLKVTDSLKSTIEWLNARKYLPEEGIHFKMVESTSTIGNWRLNWYGIHSLISDAFFPL